MPFCHAANSVKALKEMQSTNHNHKSYPLAASFVNPSLDS